MHGFKYSTQSAVERPFKLEKYLDPMWVCRRVRTDWLHSADSGFLGQDVHKPFSLIVELTTVGFSRLSWRS